MSIIHVYTYDGQTLCHASSFEVPPRKAFTVEHPLGFLYQLEGLLYGINGCRVSRLSNSEFWMAYHKDGNVMIRVIGEDVQMASATEIAAYNAGVGVAIERLSYLKMMKDLILNGGIKGLLSFLVEKIQRASVFGWEAIDEHVE